jgi:hypothetical protein
MVDAHGRPQVQFREGRLKQNCGGIPGISSVEDENDDENSLSDEAQALYCHALKIGLASEARSTNKTWAKSEGRGRRAIR